MARRKSADTDTARAELARSIGRVPATACGVCGATVAADDTSAVQTRTGMYDRAGRGPFKPEPSWRYHGVCDRIRRMLEPDRSLAMLAHLVEPDARPVRLDDAVYAAAAELGAPVAYIESERAASTDRGRREPWEHVPVTERRALIERVGALRREAAAELSRWPCAVCGRAPFDAQPGATARGLRGRPTCGECAALARQAGLRKDLKTVPVHRVTEAAYPLAAALVPDGYQWAGGFALAYQRDDYGPTDTGREPWAFLDVEPVPLAPEERLAALEAAVAEQGVSLT